MTEDHRPTGFQPVQSLPPEPSQPSWLLALGALALVALGGVIVGALLFGRPGSAGPTSTPTAMAGVTASPAATASPTSPAATVAPTPTLAPTASPTLSPAPASPTDSPAGPTASPGGGTSPTTPPDVASQIETVIAQVPPIRELEPQRDVPYRTITREQFQADLGELLAEETNPVQLAAEERLLKRLGLLPDDVDLQALLLELYGAGVAAYYQPEDGTFYVIERQAPFGPLDRMYVAHEYTHALQDQYYDLEGTRITDPSEGDAALAQLAAIEGDASWLMVLWAQTHLTFEEVLELLSGESLAPADEELLESMPPILMRQLLFPYEQGLAFTSAIFEDGGWDAVNESLAQPPLSTEQVLHPEKYAAGEEPLAVELPVLRGRLGAGWTRTYEQTFGELNTDIWLTADEEPPQTMPGMPVDYPYSDVSAGWGGDRLAMYEDGEDGWAIVWITAWDSQEDAQEFAARADELRSTLDGVSLILETSEAEVWVLVANDQETIEQLRAAGPP